MTEEFADAVAAMAEAAVETKSRKYISGRDQAPEGADVQEGPQGGLFYEDEAAEPDEAYGPDDEQPEGGDADGGAPDTVDYNGEELAVEHIDEESGVVEMEGGQLAPLEEVPAPASSVEPGQTFEFQGEEVEVQEVDEGKGVLAYETPDGESDTTVTESVSLADIVDGDGDGGPDDAAVGLDESASKPLSHAAAGADGGDAEVLQEATDKIRDGGDLTRDEALTFLDNVEEATNAATEDPVKSEIHDLKEQVEDSLGFDSVMDRINALNEHREKAGGDGVTVASFKAEAEEQYGLDEEPEDSGSSEWGGMAAKQLDVATDRLDEGNEAAARKAAATAAARSLEGACCHHMEGAVDEAFQHGGMQADEFDEAGIPEAVEGSKVVGGDDLETFKQHYEAALSELGLEPGDGE